jgi:hypothetical protein
VLNATVTSRRRKTALLAGAATALAAVAMAAGATTPTAVKATARDEVGPAASGEWFAWSRSRAKEPSPFDLYVQRAGGRALRVNKKTVQAYAGGIDGTTLVYQVIRGSLATGSDLRLYDLARKRHKPLPSGIDTASWECCGTLSGDWLLFSRGRAYAPGRQLVLLRNLVTGEQRVLDTLNNKNGLVGAGQLSGTFAVWSRCNPYPSCQVFRYDIVTGSSVALTVPAGKVPYAPAVNQYGTTYFMQSNRGCGNSVQLMKQGLVGPPTLVASLPPRRDVDVAYADAVTSKPPGDFVKTRIYFDLLTCGKRQRGDIYRVDDTERLPGP